MTSKNPPSTSEAPKQTLEATESRSFTDDHANTKPNES